MRVYTLPFTALSVSAAKTLLAFRCPSTNGALLLRAFVSQQASETSEELEVAIQRVSAVGDGTFTGVTAANCPKYDPNDPATLLLQTGGTAGCSVDYTVEPTTYDTHPIIRESFNVLNGWLWVPSVEERIKVAPTGRIGLRLLNAPAAALTMSGGFVVAEL